MLKHIPVNEYYADDGLNASTIKAWYADPQIARKERGLHTFWRALAFGTLAHSIIVEGIDNSDNNPFYKIYEKGAGERRRAEEIEALGLIPISDKQHADVMTMNEIMKANHPEIAVRLAKPDGIYENSAIWWGDLGGLTNRRKFKARYDIIDKNGDGIVITDYKTTSGGLTDYNLIDTIGNYSYDIQAALYIEGIKIHYPDRDVKFSFIFQEKEEPFSVREIIIGDNMIERGRAKIKSAIFAIDNNKPYKWSKWNISTGEWHHPPTVLDSPSQAVNG